MSKMHPFLLLLLFASHGAWAAPQKNEDAAIDQKFRRNLQARKELLAEASKPRPSLPRTAWLDQFKFHFTAGYCAHNKLFEQCYHGKKQECSRSVSDSLESCASQVKLPKRVEVGDKSVTYGQQIGRCLGQQIHLKHKSRLSPMPKCQNPYAWL